MDDPSRYVVVRSIDEQVIATYPADKTAKSILAHIIRLTKSDGTLKQLHGLEVLDDEDERLQAGDYIFTPSGQHSSKPWLFVFISASTCGDPESVST